VISINLTPARNNASLSPSVIHLAGVSSLKEILIKKRKKRLKHFTYIYPYLTRRSSGSVGLNILIWSIAAKGPALTKVESAVTDNKDKDKNFIFLKEKKKVKKKEKGDKREKWYLFQKL
jgi:hypothetical protein